MTIMLLQHLKQNIMEQQKITGKLRVRLQLHYWCRQKNQVWGRRYDSVDFKQANMYTHTTRKISDHVVQLYQRR